MRFFFKELPKKEPEIFWVTIVGCSIWIMFVLIAFLISPSAQEIQAQQLQEKLSSCNKMLLEKKVVLCDGTKLCLQSTHTLSKTPDMPKLLP